MNLLRKTAGAVAGLVCGVAAGVGLGCGLYWCAFLFVAIFGTGWSEPVRTFLAGASFLVPVVFLGVTGAVKGTAWMQKP